MDFKVHRSGSTGNLYSLDGELLIECGVSIREIRKSVDFRLSDFKWCLISHEHNDHSKSKSELEALGVECFDQFNGQFKLDEYIIKPIALWHDAPCHGFIIQKGMERLFYATDTGHLPFIIPGLTHIAIECNYDHAMINMEDPKSKRLVKNHLGIEKVESFIRMNDLKNVSKINLIHASRSGNINRESAIRRIQELTGKPTEIF